MAEYTYKDIIIDPTSEEAKNAVGKICYFSDSPRTLLSEIDCKRPVEGILTNMEDGYFEVDNEGYWDGIILTKEEPKPKFIPFSNKIEFIVKFNSCTTRDDLTPYKYVLLKYGMWLKDKETDAFFMVTEIWDDGVIVTDRKMKTTKVRDDEYFTINEVTTWKELLKDYCFIDGSPCGKEVEE